MAVCLAYIAAPSIYRSEVAGPLLREAGTIAGAAGMLLSAWTTYLAAAENARGTEEMDLSLGVGHWQRHLGGSLIGIAAAACVYGGVVVAAVAMGVVVDSAFSFREYLRWALALSVLIPAAAALVQTFAIALKLWRQPVGCAMIGITLTALAWNVDTALAMDPTNTMGLLVSAAVPDVDWLRRLVLAYAYGASEAEWTVWMFCVAGVLLQTLLIGCVVRFVPLSRDYIERRSLVLARR